MKKHETKWLRVDYKYKFNRNWVYSFFYIVVWNKSPKAALERNISRHMNVVLKRFKITGVEDVTAMANKT